MTTRRTLITGIVFKQYQALDVIILHIWCLRSFIHKYFRKNADTWHSYNLWRHVWLLISISQFYAQYATRITAEIMSFRSTLWACIWQHATSLLKMNRFSRLQKLEKWLLHHRLYWPPGIKKTTKTETNVHVSFFFLLHNSKKHHLHTNQLCRHGWCGLILWSQHLHETVILRHFSFITPLAS